MQSLGDLLHSKNLDYPSELKSIEEFMQREFKFAFGLYDHPKHVTISVENGKVAYLLRSRLPDLIAYAAPTKKIFVRIDPDAGTRPSK